MIPVRSSPSVSLFPGGIKQEGHLNTNLGLTDAKIYMLSSFKNALQSGRIAPATFEIFSVGAFPLLINLKFNAQ